MRDPVLAALVEKAMGPFPRALAGEEIDGVDLVLLDEEIMGIASHYERNSRSLSDNHRSRLAESVRDLDAIGDALPTDDSREYFARARAVATYLLARRSVA